MSDDDWREVIEEKCVQVRPFALCWYAEAAHCSRRTTQLKEDEYFVSENSRWKFGAEYEHERCESFVVPFSRFPTRFSSFLVQGIMLFCRKTKKLRRKQ